MSSLFLFMNTKSSFREEQLYFIYMKDAYDCYADSRFYGIVRNIAVCSLPVTEYRNITPRIHILSTAASAHVLDSPIYIIYVWWLW